MDLRPGTHALHVPSDRMPIALSTSSGCRVGRTPRGRPHTEEWRLTVSSCILVVGAGLLVGTLPVENVCDLLQVRKPAAYGPCNRARTRASSPARGSHASVPSRRDETRILLREQRCGAAVGRPADWRRLIPPAPGSLAPIRKRSSWTRSSPSQSRTQSRDLMSRAFGGTSVG